MDYAFEVQENRIVVYEISNGRGVGDFYVLKSDVDKLISGLMSASSIPVFPRHNGIKTASDNELIAELKDRGYKGKFTKIVEI